MNINTETKIDTSKTSQNTSEKTINSNSQSEEAKFSDELKKLEQKEVKAEDKVTEAENKASKEENEITRADDKVIEKETEETTTEDKVIGKKPNATKAKDKVIVEEPETTKIKAFDKKTEIITTEDKVFDKEANITSEKKQTYQENDIKGLPKEDESKKNGIDNAIENLSTIVKKLNENSEENDTNKLNNEGKTLINNEYNMPDKNQLTPQMNPNMNFSGDNNPFSSLMGEENKKNSGVLRSTKKELDEESQILSTMSENIAIANQNNQLVRDTDIKVTVQNNTQEKTVSHNDGIKTINVESGITIETVVKYNNIIMSEADVEVFANLVQNKEVNLNTLTDTEVKSVQISKTLADMLVRAKETNQPLRIDFDNDISVIIRISRDGKVSADFLPSSQVAETYLKENLPLLKQRFDENNIEYDELNQKNSKNKDHENNKRKDRNNE